MANTEDIRLTALRGQGWTVMTGGSSEGRMFGKKWCQLRSDGRTFHFEGETQEEAISLAWSTALKAIDGFGAKD
jgi:hypothetical protein